MNVFGKNERSWRKARKRGVSPIIATILLVAITVVLAAVLYVLISGLTSGGVGSRPIGGAFSAGSPVLSSVSGTAAAPTCTAGTALTTLLGAGTWYYTLTVESSSITLTSALFEVKTATGAIDTVTTGGAFYVANVAGNAVTCQVPSTATTMAMTTAFSTFAATPNCNSGACSASTPMTSIYTIVIDMGSTNPGGTGLSFVAIGASGYSGTTSLSLP